MNFFSGKGIIRQHPSFLKKIGIAFALFLSTQWLFFFLNRDYFSIVSVKECILILLGSIQYAIAATTLFLFPYIGLYFLPLRLREHKIYQRIVESLYYIGSVLLFAINIIDIVYYRFTFRRMAGDIFQYLSVGGDFKELIPQFLKDFWPFALFFVIVISVLIWVAGRYGWDSHKGISPKRTIPTFLGVIFAALLLSQIGFITRLSTKQVVWYTSPANAALVMNTPFSILSTLGASGVKEVAYFENDAEAEKVFSPVHTPNPRSGVFAEAPTTNVVVILLESFSAEYMGFLNEGKESYTPFLDSLAKKSILFNGMANGKRSIESVPSCVSGLPSIMSDAFITSPYGANNVNSLASVLKKYGYYSAFFHGGYNGSMGFDYFVKRVGYDDYFGMDEYNNKKDYDGHWGIFDEPFMQYMAEKMNTFQTPFTTGVFMLSSHHPYTLPKGYEGRFKKGEIPILELVMYADNALKEFFETASQSEWYKNTLFVITADHTGQPIDKLYGNAYGMYKVPMIFYNPSDSSGRKINRMVQQVDILPTVLDYLDINEKCIAFGKSAYSNDSIPFHMAYTNGFYQMVYGNHLIFFNEKIVAVYDVIADPSLRKNLYRSEEFLFLERKIKACIQQYNHRLIKNQLTIGILSDNEQ